MICVVGREKREWEMRWKGPGGGGEEGLKMGRLGERGGQRGEEAYLDDKIVQRLCWLGRAGFTGAVKRAKAGGAILGRGDRRET